MLTMSVVGAVQGFDLKDCPSLFAGVAALVPISPPHRLPEGITP